MACFNQNTVPTPDCVFRKLAEISEYANLMGYTETQIAGARSEVRLRLMNRYRAGGEDLVMRADPGVVIDSVITTPFTSEDEQKKVQAKLSALDPSTCSFVDVYITGLEAMKDTNPIAKEMLTIFHNPSRYPEEYRQLLSVMESNMLAKMGIL